VLATADPQGRATTGIVRKQTNRNDWEMDDKIKFAAQGGDDAWDNRYYLNFWVGNLFNLLGYSSVPGGPAEKDGVVIHVSAFGTVNTGAPYNLGRTAVHEVGHWLGLKHIWGDAFCGDDLVDDTPKQGNFTSGCPNGFRSSCSNGDMGDMYMNYMDYTNDACLNLFTNGQKQRMLSLFNTGGPRNSILVSKGLNKPWTQEIPVTETISNTIKIYPNPSRGDVALQLTESERWIGKKIVVMNASGSVLFQVQISSRTQKLDLGHLKPGLYFIEGENGSEKIREKLVKL
jgi:hypothetical protein